jgi:hypothetical protein
MNKFYAIYVPSTINQTESANSLSVEMTDMVFAKMISLFGGATLVQGIGGFALENGQIVKEVVYIIKSYCDEASYKKMMTKVIALAADLCEKMSQECVSVESSDGLQFVKPMKIAA